MTVNRELSRIFDEIASALELLGANPFRANAYRRMSRTLRDLATDVREFGERNPQTAVMRLETLPGIGKSAAEKIVEYLASGEVREHRKLLEKVPSGLFEVLAIPGVGPKAAKLMWEDLGIESIDDLKAALDSPALAALPRMGKRTVENLRQAIAFGDRAQDRIPLGQAYPIAVELAAALRRVPGVRRLEYAGSLRRGRDTIGDLDFLAVADDPGPLRERFLGPSLVRQVLARGETKLSVRLEVANVSVQADLRIVPEGSWGAALLYFTGSKEHNVRLRELAIARGMRLNEYGLYAGTAERPQERGAEPVAAATEEEIYAALGLPWIAPELRQDRGEFEVEPPRLIEIGDVGAELHAHTTASDGKLTIAELAHLAKARGLQTLAITDHSPAQTITGGLSAERLLRHVEAVREADHGIEGIRLLAGSEVDILADGRLDYDDEVLARLDIVVASPHAALRQEPNEATRRLLRAIRHPLVHVLGHPTGRRIHRRPGLSPDVEALAEAAAEHDVALELNANWSRLDLRSSHLRVALARGCKVAINTDAHREEHFENLIYGILTARRAGLEAASCVNTWPAEELMAWLGSKR